MTERRSRARDSTEDQITGILVAASDALERKQDTELLGWAEAVRRIADARTLDDRRSMVIAARRVFRPEVLKGMIQHALRHPEVEARTAAIMAWIGPEGLEAMIDAVVASEAVPPVQFLHDALVAEPGAFPLILPLVSNSRAHVVRHGAELLGRLGDRRALDALGALLEHPGERVRAAAIRAVAQFEEPGADSLLRGALGHSSPATRREVARTLAESQRAALVGSIVEAFDRELESPVRRELAGAAARLGATDALVHIALDRKTFFRRRGRPAEVRVDAVMGLAAADSPETRRLLDGLVRKGDAPVRDAADRALSVRRAATR